MKKEIWKDVVGYEGLYKVSNKGRVASIRPGCYRLLKLTKNAGGYLFVGLRKDNKSKSTTVHKLVAMAFLNHEPVGYRLIINHKDFNRQNNNIENIEIITSRENANKKHLVSSSQYTGVCWCNTRNKWLSSILINRKRKHLGYFTDEYEAHLAYELALNTIINKNQ